LPFVKSQRAPPWLRSGSDLALMMIFLLSAAVCLMNARAAQFLLPAMSLVLLGVLARRRLAAALPAFDAVAASISAFIAYAATSALWSIGPARSLSFAGAAAIIASASLAAARLVHAAPPSSVLPMAMGLWIGFLVGALFCLFELLTGHVAKVWLLESLGLPSDMRWRLSGHGSLGDPFGLLNRSITTLTFMLWPVLMVVEGIAGGRWRKAAAIGLAALSLTVVMLSAHTTSKVAIVAGPGSSLSRSLVLRAGSPCISLQWRG
jgi:hypothetical protein